MSNMNVKKRLDYIQRNLAAVHAYVAQHGGISAADASAMAIDTIASTIAEDAAHVAARARLVRGDRSGVTLVRNIRKALGFLMP